jgi:hypothetical protein
MQIHKQYQLGHIVLSNATRPARKENAFVVPRSSERAACLGLSCLCNWLGYSSPSSNQIGKLQFEAFAVMIKILQVLQVLVAGPSRLAGSSPFPSSARVGRANIGNQEMMYDFIPNIDPTFWFHLVAHLLKSSRCRHESAQS